MGTTAQLLLGKKRGRRGQENPNQSKLRAEHYWTSSVSFEVT